MGVTVEGVVASKLTKRQKTVGDKVDSNKLYAFDALGLVKEFAVASSMSLSMWSCAAWHRCKKTDQVVRGAVVMLHRHRQDQACCRIRPGAKAEEAKAAGADIVIRTIWLPISRLARWTLMWSLLPDAMRIVGTWARSLAHAV
jgi:large subunit ribosomal protein L1